MANIEDNTEIVSLEVDYLLRRVKAYMYGMLVAEEGEGGSNIVEKVEEEAVSEEENIFKVSLRYNKLFKK